MSAYSSLEPDSLYQVNDEDIRKALETNPQIHLPLNLAIYNSSQNTYAFEDSISTLAELNRVIEISPALLDASSYYKSQQYGGWNRYPSAPVSIDLKKLRLYAAQAKSDLVLFISTSHSFKEDVNILSPLYAGLITIPFIPGQNVRLDSFMEAYIIDVRNGFLYASHRDKKTLKKKFARVFFRDKIDVYQRRHIDSMIPDLLTFVTSTLENPDFRLHSTVAND